MKSVKIILTFCLLLMINSFEINEEAFNNNWHPHIRRSVIIDENGNFIFDSKDNYDRNIFIKNQSKSGVTSSFLEIKSDLKSDDFLLSNRVLNSIDQNSSNDNILNILSQANKYNCQCKFIKDESSDKDSSKNSKLNSSQNKDTNPMNNENMDTNSMNNIKKNFKSITEKNLRQKSIDIDKTPYSLLREKENIKEDKDLLEILNEKSNKNSNINENELSTFFDILKKIEKSVKNKSNKQTIKNDNFNLSRKNNEDNIKTNKISILKELLNSKLFDEESNNKIEDIKENTSSDSSAIEILRKILH